MSQEKLILFGAGSAGKYCLRHLRERGIEPLCFADNRAFASAVEGLSVHYPFDAMEKFPDAIWICAAISRPAASEIRHQLKHMGVKTKPLFDCLPVFHDNPSGYVQSELIKLCADAESVLTLQDLYRFRENPDYEKQRDPSPISELYFPPFISHLDAEHLVDAGACCGDTVEAFVAQWKSWSLITAFEPDRENFEKLRALTFPGSEWLECRHNAVGDSRQMMAFQANGDYSSHLSAHVSQPATTMVECVKLDDAGLRIPPTYMKFDVEGFELQALWGARRILKEHSPVLAVCAYHTSDHTWEIPKLVCAIQPNYHAYFRRYAEAAFEIVWYFVPLDRVVPPWTIESYSDNHTG